MKSAKIMPTTAARSWLFPKISANPFLALAEKRRFYRPKLPALRADVDRLAQKSAKPFLLLPPLAALLSAGDCPEALRLLCCSSAGFSRTPAQRPVFWYLAGTRSTVPRKPHKPPTRARRRGTRCRSQLHLLYGHILLLQNLLTELI